MKKYSRGQYVSEMSVSDQKKIESDLRNALKSDYSEEDLEFVIEGGLDSRLSDLEDTINIQPYLSVEKNVRVFDKLDYDDKVNSIYYLGRRNGYWLGVSDMVSGLISSLEEIDLLKPKDKKIAEDAIEGSFLYTYVLDKAKDKYPDAELFGKITVMQRLKNLQEICNKEIEFSNEEFRDEYVR